MPKDNISQITSCKLSKKSRLFNRMLTLKMLQFKTCLIRDISEVFVSLSNKTPLMNN